MRIPKVNTDMVGPRRRREGDLGLRTIIWPLVGVTPLTIVRPQGRGLRGTLEHTTEIEALKHVLHAWRLISLSGQQPNDENRSLEDHENQL